MGILRKLFRAQPTLTADGAFSPSPLAIKLGTSSTTDYDGGAYAKRHDGTKNRVLMVCTEERNMTMANGKWQEILDGKPPCRDGVANAASDKRRVRD